MKVHISGGGRAYCGGRTRQGNSQRKLKGTWYGASRVQSHTTSVRGCLRGGKSKSGVTSGVKVLTSTRGQKTAPLTATAIQKRSITSRNFDAFDVSTPKKGKHPVLYLQGLVQSSFSVSSSTRRVHLQECSHQSQLKSLKSKQDLAQRPAEASLAWTPTSDWAVLVKKVLTRDI